MRIILTLYCCTNIWISVAATTCSQGSYTLRLGDTLFSISRQHKTTTANIISINNNVDWDLLRPGETICVPDSDDPDVADVDSPIPTPVDPNVSVDDEDENPAQITATTDSPQDSCTNLPSPITAGIESAAHAWPWQVLIGMAAANGSFPHNSFCGGVLIGNQTVLTAAHCITQCLAKDVCLTNNKKLSGYRVGLGVHRRSRFQRYVNISKIYLHKDYNYENKHGNDVAILRLARPVKFNRKIQPIRLPKRDFRICAGSEVVVTGWGQMDEMAEIPNSTAVEQESFSDVLQQGKIRTFESATCQRAFGDMFSPTTMLCAGTDGGGTDACRGDSGGPLVLYDPRRGSGTHGYVLIGLVSWGVGCGTPGNPGVYTKIPQFVPWIKEIQKRGQMDI